MERVGQSLSLWLAIILLGLGMSACKEEPPKQNPKAKPTHVRLKIPAFNADSAYQYTKDQVDMGPRVPGTAAHSRAIRYYKSKLASFGAIVKLQSFKKARYDGMMMKGTNVIAAFNPKKKKRLLLCAHWDSRFIAEKDKNLNKQKMPVPGADDGATGVGVLIEIARQISLNPLKEVGLDIVLFDLEDQGKNGPDPANTDTWGLGAQYWSSNLPKGYRPRFGVLLDMVGAKGAIFPKEGYSLKNAKSQTDKIWRLAQGMGFGNLFINDPGGSITDDHYFVMRNAKIPMVDIIHMKLNGQFGSYHHTHDDDMNIVDRTTLKATGQTTLATVYHFHNGTF